MHKIIEYHKLPTKEQEYLDLINSEDFDLDMDEHCFIEG